MAKKNTTKKVLQTEFPVDLLENQDGQELVLIGTHLYYNLDGKVKLSAWVQPNQRVALISSIATTDGIKIRKPGEGSIHARTCNGTLGFINLHSNVVEKNAQYVGLYSFPCTDQGYNILPENFERVVAAFAARKLVDNQWFNTRDCYMVPDIDHTKYADWQKDCYIFSMFHSASNQTSIKGIVDGIAYDFKNNFYPFSKRATYGFLGIQEKANFQDESRFIASKLTSLTPEGQKVLDDFKACLKASAKDRPAYAKSHPELQVQRWDAGWRQLKGLFEESCPKEFASLKADFKALKEKMLPLVYELGFLNK